MRNLTLGVLIISGGVLAALPFQRRRADHGATIPEEATGPTGSVLNPSLAVPSSAPYTADMFPSRNVVSPAPHDLAGAAIGSQAAGRDSLPKVQHGADGTAMADSALVSQRRPSDSRPHQFASRSADRALSGVTRSPSRIDKPLTFEDLMEPIERPEPVRERFSALAEVRQGEIERSRAAIAASLATANPFEKSASPIAAVRGTATRSSVVISLPAPPADLASTLSVAGAAGQGRPPMPPVGQSSTPAGMPPRETLVSKNHLADPTPMQQLPKPQWTEVDARQWIVQP